MTACNMGERYLVLQLLGGLYLWCYDFWICGTWNSVHIMIASAEYNMRKNDKKKRRQIVQVKQRELSRLFHYKICDKPSPNAILIKCDRKIHGIIDTYTAQHLTLRPYVPQTHMYHMLQHNPTLYYLRQFRYIWPRTIGWRLGIRLQLQMFVGPVQKCGQFG